MLFHVLKSINNNSNRSNTVPSSLLYSHAFIRRCIRTGFCSPDLTDFHDFYISSDEKLFYKILTCPNHGHSCHHLLHKITVLEIDLTIDSYLTAFLDCNFTVRMLYRNMYWLLYILDLRFVLFLCTTAVWQFTINKYVMLLCYAQLCQSGQRCWLWDCVDCVKKNSLKLLQPAGKLSIIVTSMPVCVYFPLMYISGTACPDFAKLSVSVTYGCGSVLLRRHCDMLCTSGFVDDAMFAHSSQERATWKMSTHLSNFPRDVVARIWHT